MCVLTDIIITGWPDNIKVVSHPLQPYWQHLETLTIKDGLVLCGEALIVPPFERERVLQQIHQSHQGITKAPLLMHRCIFWPGINKAIEEVVCQCEICTQFQAQNAAAPHTPTPTPSCPWQMCATDIFTLEGVDYLLPLLLKDDPHPMSSIWPEQHHQSCLTAQGNVLRAWNSGSPLL